MKVNIYDKLYIAMSAIIIIAAIFFCGLTLTTCTIIIILIILWAASGRPSINPVTPHLIWPIHLILGGGAALLTLHSLYNPSKEVFTNTDHHVLSLTGYETNNDTLYLFDRHSSQTIWDNKELGNSATLIRQGDKIKLTYATSQPVYKKLTGLQDVLINSKELPSFNKSFTLFFKGDTAGIRVTIEDIIREDRPFEFILDKLSPLKKYTCNVDVAFIKHGKSTAAIRGGYHQFVRRSLPLYDFISDIPIPDSCNLNLEALRGITLLRDTAGAKSEDIPLNSFHIAFSPEALQSVSKLIADKSYSRQDLIKTGSMEICDGDAIKFGAGFFSTPYIHPKMTNGKLSAELDVPLRQSLPKDPDSLNAMQTAIITSDIIEMAFTQTELALHYPVFQRLKKNQQFQVAMEYLPENTLVPLTCKLVPLSNDKVFNGNNQEISLIYAGDKFRFDNKQRDINPIFKFDNLRTLAPFSTTKGYLLIIAVLLAAFLSMAASRGRFEPKGETVVWLVLIALLVYRSFIAWRSSVFPPLDGFSIDSFRNYLSDDYTFLWTLGAIIALTIILVTFKLAYNPLKNHPKLVYTIILLTILFLIIIIIVWGNKRLLYIYFPTVLFLCFEWHYQRMRVSFSSTLYKWNIIRYTAMILLAVYMLALDAGFGVVFTLFLLLYIALDNYLALTFKEMRNNPWRKKVVICFLILSFIILMFFGVHVVSLIYRHFTASCILLSIILASCAFSYYKNSKATPWRWRWFPLAAIWLILIGYIGIGNSYLDSHRHLLYRAEVHSKPTDKIIMEEEVDTRDLERLFQASQNRWFLGYYTETLDKAWNKPYKIRSHFNKGITWHTQKTDAVLGRYVIGEHSISAAYILILLFCVLFGCILSTSRENKKFRLLGMGVCLLLLCQAIFITLAVTNRFIFFGQDYPLISLNSALTVIMTFTLLGIVALVTTTDNTNTAYDEEYHYDWRPMTVLLLFFLISLIPGRLLHPESDKAFNVGEALNTAKTELEPINYQLREFQISHREELSNSYLLTNTHSIQNDYSEFINYFDKEVAISDSLRSWVRKTDTGVSTFTASLYALYLNKLSKNNKADDIIHLRRRANGLLEFNISNGFYRLTTPESRNDTWKGNIVPEIVGSEFSHITLNRSDSTENLAIKQNSMRIDSRPEISYDFPLYFAKINKQWTSGNQDYYIVGKEKQNVIVKKGAKKYNLADASKASHYLVVSAGDLIGVKSDEYAVTNSIHIRGEQDKYFAKNILVNGLRTMIYPMGEKFFYPYHLAQIATKTLSGKETPKQSKDIKLTLSYQLTENLFDNLNNYKGDTETYARSLIVADGDGHIKAMVTTKNSNAPSGYLYVNPNDIEGILKLQNQYYLTGDVIGERQAFGDLNLTYLQPGPGSSIKPITFTSVMSQAYFDWGSLALYVNPKEQKLIITYTSQGNPHDISTNRYAGKRLDFSSLYNDEIGENGLTDIALYMKKSSNYFNSLMVYTGFYKGDYLSHELANASKGIKSELFKPYESNDTLHNFPAFRIGKRTYMFRNWITEDGMPRHEGGALQIGFENNFKLWKEEPQALFDTQTLESINLLNDSAYGNILQQKDRFPFVFPAVSYLPEKDRITRQGTHDAIRNTTLGASPFQITPFKMAEMYGKLFSQNSNYLLTLNPVTKPEYKPFYRALGYEKDKTYEKILSNHLFKGMADVPRTGGTARLLNNRAEKLKEQGYFIYAKTGTIGSVVKKNNSQLLAVVITKEPLDGIDNADDFMNKVKKHKFYVMYFHTEHYYHNYEVIEKAITTIVDSKEFKDYMKK